MQKDSNILKNKFFTISLAVVAIAVVAIPAVFFYNKNLSIKKANDEATRRNAVNKAYTPINFTTDSTVSKVDGSTIITKKDGVTVGIKIDADTKFYKADGSEGKISDLKDGTAIKSYFQDEKLKAVRY